MPRVTYLTPQEPARRTLITSKEAAEILHVTPHTLQRFRREGRGPEYIQVTANVILYMEEEVYEWLETGRRRSTSDKGAAR